MRSQQVISLIPEGVEVLLKTVEPHSWHQEDGSRRYEVYLKDVKVGEVTRSRGTTNYTQGNLIYKRTRHWEWKYELNNLIVGALTKGGVDTRHFGRSGRTYTETRKRALAQLMASYRKAQELAYDREITLPST